MNKYLTFFLLFFIIYSLKCKQQKVRVRGAVYCVVAKNYNIPDEASIGHGLTAGDHPNRIIVQGETINLFESDSGWFGDEDDLLDKSETNMHGEFELNGKENEFGSIEPYLWISSTACRSDSQKKKPTPVKAVRMELIDDFEASNAYVPDLQKPFPDLPDGSTAPGSSKNCRSVVKVDLPHNGTDSTFEQVVIILGAGNTNIICN
uniref:Uncharacterized protein n=1 Tax=Ditylenchus dipsaci TaxID=166011 RepID=A0A915ETI9_9BILA